MTERIILEHEPEPSPERKLVASVIAQAILDLKDEDSRYPAAEWLLDKCEEPWTFRWCCLQLDYDPNKMLRKIWDHVPGGFDAEPPKPPRLVSYGDTCVHGHVGDWWVNAKGRRDCRGCQRERDAKRREERKKQRRETK